MEKETDQLNKKILESARSEFLSHGYQDASLRRICRAAGLTTGALYKRYESKDSLFTALLEPTLEALDCYGQEQKQRDYAFLEEGHLSSMWSHRLEDLQSLMQILYEHKDIMRLLLFKSQGSSQADFRTRLPQLATDETYRYLELAYKEGKIDYLVKYEFLRSCMTAYYTAIFEPLAQDWSQEQALEFCHSILDLFDWGGLLGF